MYYKLYGTIIYLFKIDYNRNVDNVDVRAQENINIYTSIHKQFHNRQHERMSSVAKRLLALTKRWQELIYAVAGGTAISRRAPCLLEQLAPLPCSPFDIFALFWPSYKGTFIGLVNTYLLYYTCIYGAL